MLRVCAVRQTLERLQTQMEESGRARRLLSRLLRLRGSTQQAGPASSAQQAGPASSASSAQVGGRAGCAARGDGRGAGVHGPQD